MLGALSFDAYLSDNNIFSIDFCSARPTIVIDDDDYEPFSANGVYRTGAYPIEYPLQWISILIPLLVLVCCNALNVETL